MKNSFVLIGVLALLLFVTGCQPAAEDQVATSTDEIEDVGGVGEDIDDLDVLDEDLNIDDLESLDEDLDFDL